MFYAYIVHDVVEVEPVYLPKPSALAATAVDSSHSGQHRQHTNPHDNRSNGAPVDDVPVKREKAEDFMRGQDTSASRKPISGSVGGKLSLAAATNADVGPSPSFPHQTTTTATAPQSLVKTLFGSVDQLRRFLLQQVSRRMSDDGDEHHHTRSGTSNTQSASDSPDSDDYAVGITDAILHRLTEKYVGRVLPRCGLCVAIRDVLELSPAEIRGPSASAWVGVVFEACVLSPASGCRLKAKVLAHHSCGLFLSLIDLLSGTISVFVEAAELVSGSCYDTASGRWYLSFVDDDKEEGDEQDEEVEAQGRRNYYHIGETVLFKVLDTVVKDEHSAQEAIQKREQLLQQQQQQPGMARQESSQMALDIADALMHIRGSFQGDGLGPVSWFADDAAAAAEEEETSR